MDCRRVFRSIGRAVAMKAPGGLTVEIVQVAWGRIFKAIGRPRSAFRLGAAEPVIGC
jgi:hypothetical protein